MYQAKIQEVAAVLRDPAQIAVPHDIEAGDAFELADPELQIDVLVVADLRPLRAHVLTVNVTPGGNDTAVSADFQILRLVAGTGAQEVEVLRTVRHLPAPTRPVIDASRCNACGGRIPSDTAVIHDGAAYHGTCLTNEGEEGGDE